nr:hypothetical protein [Mycobacterium riyadhense]
MVASDQSAYLEKRQLKTGSAGWLLLAGLGISYVVSGDYSGWNFGLARGGFGGLLIAAAVIAAMYLALVLGIAELSSALPAAGGGYTFARRALGPWGGFTTGTALLIEYSIAPAAIATFIGAYVQSLGLFGIRDGWWVRANWPAPTGPPGGILTTGFALVVAALALIATFLVDSVAAICCLAVFCAFLLYFASYSQHRLVAHAPDEETARS